MFHDSLLPVLVSDFYKFSHPIQYPKGTQCIYSTWTPRNCKLKHVKNVVSYGQQAVLTFIHEFFEKNFFERPFDEIEKEYKHFFKTTCIDDDVDTTRIKQLHDIGYLPIKVMIIPEGVVVPIKTPILTIENTKPECYWLTNFLETMMSAELWHMATSATIAKSFRELLDHYADLTSDIPEFVDFQSHDFSMRGMSGIFSASSSGSGHLLSFKGTDTAPAVLFHNYYYKSDIEDYLVGTSIPATEHSVMCANGQDEYSVIKRLITEVYPTGPVSIVVDTWDYWNVLKNVIPRLENEILNRDGKVVIRPDSGDPVKIICGDSESENPIEKIGTISHLWDVFGGDVNAKGFKQLNSKIGVIYGDAITYDVAKTICQNLKDNGFASTNIVFGVGSFTYQYNTRDTLGFALKSTYAKINDVGKFIFKDPKTDCGIKKSHIGKVLVSCDLETYDMISCLDGNINIMKLFYQDGIFFNKTRLNYIRSRLQTGLKVLDGCLKNGL